MQFGPRFHQSLLTLRKRAGDKSNRMDSKNCSMFLIIGVEVRLVMTCRGLSEHADNDPVETR